MTALLEGQARDIAAQLAEAESSRTGIDRVSNTFPGMTVDDAYRVQEIGIARRIAAGEEIVGRKIGLTSAAMQTQLGVDEPDFGVITDAMVITDGGTLDTATLIAPRLEPEFAFKLARALPENPSLAAVRAAIGAVAVSIEVIDSRVRDWDIGLVDTVADNASCARVIVGEWRTADETLLSALADVRIDLVRDGETVDSGLGSAVLGDPTVAVQWLAQSFGKFGQTLEAGSIVLAGSVCAAAKFAAGQRWECRADGFEPVSVVTA